MIKYLIHRPVAVTMILIALVVIGIVGIKNIPVSLMPDIDIPQITVQESMPGCSAQEMEKRVIAPLRGQLAQVSGVKSISSDSRMEVGNILLKFEPGANIDMLFIEVNEKIDMAMGNMPKDVVRPKVIKASASDIPAFFLNVSFRGEPSGQEASAKFAQLSDFARNVVCRRLEQLPSTAMVDMSGLTTSEIQCVPDADKLAALGITVEELQRALAENDIRLSALTVADGIYQYNVQFDSQILTVDDVRNVYINHEGRMLQLKDLCKIEEHPAIRRNIVRHNGKNCVTLCIIKQKEAQMDVLKSVVDSVIDDLEAQNGGNCEYTVPCEIFTTEKGVKVIGYTDLPGRLPTQSSQLYGTNLVNLLKLLCKEKDGNITVDFDDVVIRGVTVIRAGEITWPAPPIQVSAQPQAAQKAAPEVKTEEKCACSPWRKYALMALAIILFGWLASVAPKEFLGHFTVFALACVVGYYVVWNVSHALHTPLMSVTNAISGIIVVGALLQIGQGGWVSFLSFIAVLIASINIFGGFTVTQRMLKMFRKN